MVFDINGSEVSMLKILGGVQEQSRSAAVGCVHRPWKCNLPFKCEHIKRLVVKS